MSNDTDKALCWMGVGVSVAVVGAALAWVSVRDEKDSAASSPKALRTVDRVDLARYMGTWYEISRFPNPFEGDCAGGTVAHYSLQDDGRIKILNSCRTSKGKTQTVRGVAKVQDPVTNAKLKVRYRWPFSGDYWVLVLNSFYEYAVVGEPSRKYLWVLSRTPVLDKSTYRGILQRIEELGYDSSKLRLTTQSQRVPQVGNTVVNQSLEPTGQNSRAGKAKVAIASR
jgi:apolipoprotein D and lipocalin family protein